MTDDEIQEIVNLVVERLRDISLNIDELADTSALSVNDYFELNGGRKVSLNLLKEYLRGIGVYLEMLRTDNSITPTDDNIMSSLRVLQAISQSLGQIEAKYLRKDQPDQTNYLIKLLGGAEVGDAVDSMLAGRGTILDPNGRIQTTNLEVRGAMKVMSLIINEIHAMAGDWAFSDCGKINEVEYNSQSDTYVLTIDKDTDWDWTSLDEGDICYSIVNTLKQGGTDYFTSWMRVLNKNISANTLEVVLYPDSQVPGGANFPPVAGFNLSRRGNVNALLLPDQYGERGKSWLLSSREGRIMFLQNVIQPVLQDYNYALTLGKLPDIKALENLPVTTEDVGLVAQTIITEKLYQFDWNGDIVCKKVDRGDWSLEVATSESPYRYITTVQSHEGGITTYTELEQHTVRHLGCTWACIADQTTQEPAWNSTDWTLIEGLRDLSLEFVSSNGSSFYAGAVDTVVTPILKYGIIDISSDVQASDWVWSRESTPADAALDAAWTAAHANNGRELHLTNADLPASWNRSHPVKFTCTAYVRVGGLDGQVDVTDVSNTVTI